MILVVQEVMTLCSTMASPHSDYLRLQEENYRVKNCLSSREAGYIATNQAIAMKQARKNLIIREEN